MPNPQNPFARAIHRQLQEAERARAEGNIDLYVQRILAAATNLEEGGDLDEGIQLLMRSKQHRAAAEMAARAGDLERAVVLFQRAGDHGHAAQLRLRLGDDLQAADIYERGQHFAEAAQIHEARGDLVRAANLWDRAGQKERAADLLVRAIAPDRPHPIVGLEAQEICRRAAVLYAKSGKIDRAVAILLRAGQGLFAGQLLASAGRHEEAIRLLAAHGDTLAAAEVAKSAGQERLAAMLLGERAEAEGRLDVAAEHFAQGGDFPRAARTFEFAGDLARAALAHEKAKQFQAAAAIYERLGRTDDAMRCLEADGRRAEAEALLDRSRVRTGQIEAFAREGELIAAAEAFLARARAGDPHAYAEATRLLWKIEATDQKYVRARTLLAEAVSEQGNTKGALRLLHELLHHVVPSGEHKAPLYLYGRLLEREGYLAESRSVFKKLASIDPSFMDVGQRVAMLAPPAPAAAPPGYAPMLAPDALAAAMRELALLEAQLGGATLEPRDAALAGNAVIAQAGAAGAASAPPPAPAPAAPPPPPEIERPKELLGLMLRGRFRIEKKLGAGAHAEVFLARDIVLDRPVAIKILNESIASEEAGLQRFLNEARLAARIRHGSCLAIFDFGEERGLTFMAMEYFEGKTLAQRLKAGRLEPRRAFDVFSDVGGALSAAHAEGIVHRDVKPSNILVDDSWRVRLTDFGVATNLLSDPGTPPGVMIGSLGYMPPEQARGGVMDHRADLFSLGVVLFEMLAGKPPFEPTIDALLQRVQGAPPDLPADVAVPDKVRALLKKCLDPSANGRFASMAEALSALAAAGVVPAAPLSDGLELDIETDEGGMEPALEGA